MASSRKVMGKLAIPTYLKRIRWAAKAVIFGASIGIFLA
jgi:hypothetical protein